MYYINQVISTDTVTPWRVTSVGDNARELTLCLSPDVKASVEENFIM